jgi:uncharacterized protein YecE (DUF72 family)
VERLAEIHLGTSAFTAAGWEGSFYPRGMKSADYLTFYARHFDTVEVDSTFYACPSVQTVDGWARKTPRDFIFSVKVPKMITHDKVLVDCAVEFDQFIGTIRALGEKLGPVVLQFPFFDRGIFKTQIDFLDRLIPFLKKLPPGFRFAVEIRNKEWLNAQFASVLRDFRVALVLQDQSWMPNPEELSQNFDPITTDWTYIRWLGDRKGIERVTTNWNKTVVDRTGEMTRWVDVCYVTTRRGVTIFGYANNHYSGHAPATVRQFRGLWSAKNFPALWTPAPPEQSPSPTLFDL